MAARVTAWMGGVLLALGVLAFGGGQLTGLTVTEAGANIGGALLVLLGLLLGAAGLLTLVAHVVIRLTRR